MFNHQNHKTMYKDLDLNKLFEEAVEARAYALAKEMLEVELKRRPLPPSDIAPNGEVITPCVFDGEKILTSKQVEALLGVKYPALWKMHKNGRLSYRKVGARILYSYEDVKAFINPNTSENENRDKK